MVDDRRQRILGVKLCVTLVAIDCFTTCFCPYNTYLCRALSLMPSLSFRSIQHYLLQAALHEFWPKRDKMAMGKTPAQQQVANEAPAASPSL